MEQIVVPIVEIIAKYAGPVGRWLCYSFRYRSNIENMKKEEKQLRDDENTLRLRVDAAKSNGEKIYDKVTSWLTNVEAEEENFREVLKVEVKTGCSFGACLDVKRRHQQSHRAKKIAQAICNLRTEMGRFDAVSCRLPPQELITSTDPNYVMLESRRRSTEGLLNALRDTEIKVIGVWGMGGVGKTTLVKQVARQAQKENLYDEVAIASVTASPDPKGIQTEIAEMLGLKFDEESVTVRASRLRERIKQDKKTLIILDDIWKQLDLEAIGIPSEGCKLILISRNRDVLISDMGTEKDFGLGVLSKGEAWSLFEKMGGNSVKDPNILPTATEVAEKCGGLPIALVTVSKALKNKDLHQWKDARRQLRRSDNGDTGILSTVYIAIELSYKHLESKEVQSVFLHCALLGYSFFFHYLVKYCYGLGLLHGISTLEEATNRLSSVVRTLEDSCLLLRNPNNPDEFAMHYIVRSVARHIASKNHNMLVMSDDGGLNAWPDVDILRRCEAFSVPGGDIRELHSGMECSKLRLFSVINLKERSLQMPDAFFQGLENLRLLNLTRMQLPSLPPSLLVLINLQTLCLEECKLGDISKIGELKNLVVLSLVGSDISQLPGEIGGLTNLQMLDLTNCSKLKVIPPNVLSSLVKLEALCMGNSFIQWEAEGLDNNERKNASLVELKCIQSHLSALSIHIPDSNILPKDLIFENLERYAIFIGDVWAWGRYSELRSPRTLKLKLTTSFQIEAGINMMLKKSQSLFIDDLKGVMRFVDDLAIEGFQHLKHLHIQNNAEIKHLIYSRMSSCSIFPALKTILLKNMINLEGICRGQLPSTSFGKLGVIKVEHCEKLKFIFLSSVARGLPLLKELDIKECSIMCAAVVKEAEGEIEDGDTILFPQLRKLLINGLPKLTRFLSTRNLSISNNGHEEIIPNANREFHMPVLHEQVSFPQLEVLELPSIALEEMGSSCKLTNIQPSSKFQNLSYLTVKGTCNVRYLFSLSTATSLVQLKALRVFECKDVEEILIEDLGEGTIASPQELFPRLEFLWLKDLLILKRFCIQRNMQFLSLKTLIIEHCPKLMSFIFNPDNSSLIATKEVREMNANERPHSVTQPLFTEQVAFPSLEKLVISYIVDMEIMWQYDRFAGNSFCKLQSMKVEGCANLKSIFPYGMFNIFQCLETLDVVNCGSLREVFEIEVSSFQETRDATATQLKKLNLSGVPKLKHIWNRDPCGMFSFRNLCSVSAKRCKSMKSVFPASISENLMQLEYLNIDECGVEVIIEKEGEEIAAPLEFPKLTSLKLVRLPELKCFSLGVCPSEWPSLKILWVCECKEIEIFTSKYSCFQETFQQRQLEGSDQQCRFVVEEVMFPKLEALKLSSIALEEMARSSWRLQNLSYLSLKGSCNIRYLFSFSTARFMVQLKDLEVWECKDMEEILLTDALGEGKITSTRDMFPRLESLRLKDLPILKRFCIGQNIQFLSLKSLSIDHCPKLMSFIYNPDGSTMITGEEVLEMNANVRRHNVTQPLFNEEVAFPSLERLVISHIVDMEIMWHDRFAGNSFCKLQSMKVEGCANLKSIFPYGMFKIFQCLETLDVVDCGSLREVFDVEVPSFQETCDATATQLKKLNLSRVPKLKHIWNRDPRGMFSFRNLCSVSAKRCKSMKSVFPASISENLMQLEYLKIQECGVEVIIEKEGEEIAAPLEFPKLTSLKLVRLPELKCFSPEVRPLEWPSLKILWVCECKEIEIFASKYSSFQETFQQRQLEGSVQQRCFAVEEVVFPKLEALKLSSIALEEMARSSWRLQNLSYLSLKGSCNIRYLFSFSAARFMVQLKDLEVWECKDMEEILHTDALGEGKITSTRDMFPRLESLWLKNLPILKRFCIGQNIQFLSLKSLSIDHCPKLMSFIYNPDSSTMITGEEVIEMNANERCHNVTQPLFNEEVTFPSLEKLEIFHIVDMEIMWHDRFPANSFCKLQSMKVEGCANLKSIFPFGMFKIFQCLETLDVVDCGSLREVFDVEVPSFQETRDVTATQLKELNLTKVPKLKLIWNKDPGGIFSFENLHRVVAEGCESMKSVFPASISENLTQLEYLEIDECGAEVIFEKEEGIEVAATVKFPKLISLLLTRSPKLKCFSPGVCPSEYPSLKILALLECKETEIFEGFLKAFQQRQLEGFVVEEGAVPDFEELGLELNDTVWPGQFLEELFCKLKGLGLMCRDNGSAFSPSTFIGRLHNVENLLVYRSRYWEEIFPYEVIVGQEQHATTLTNLRELTLIQLPMLTHLWKEDTQPCPIFHNLESLDVSECCKLKNLVPSSVSFKNLTNLEISKCHGLIELLTSSTSKSLVQLQKMSVTECKRITQIVAGEGSEADEVITFSKLTHLQLDWLPKLTNFCSGSYSFIFPSLEEVIVRQCPEMKIFCAGVISTPKLERVQARENDKWHWQDDLNTAIYWLWEGSSTPIHWLWEIDL